MELSPAIKEILRNKSAGQAPAAPVHQRPEVLVVDDEPEVVASLVELLGEEFRAQGATSGAEALGKIERRTPAVVIADQRMPEMTGVELLSEVLDRWPLVTRILMTGYADIGAVIEAVNDGRIFYYLTKPWQPEQLMAVVRRGVERNRLLIENQRLLEDLRRINQELEERVRQRTRELETCNRELEEANRKMQELARTDPLTALGNRRHLEESLEAEVELSERYSTPLSLIMLDVDHFKHINDTYGHKTGDAVLKKLGRVLVDNVRRTDLVCRYGGEEFVILLPHTPLEPAMTLAERLRGVIRSMRVDEAPPVSASFGVAERRPGEKALGLLQRADVALYRAKETGRDRVASAD